MRPWRLWGGASRENMLECIPIGHRATIDTTILRWALDMRDAGRIAMFLCREMAQADVDELVNKLGQQGVYIVQINSENFTRTFFRTQRRDRRLNIFLALSNNEIVGWTIAIQDSRRFWKTFIAHHPFWGARIILRKLMSYFRNRHNRHIVQNGKELSSAPVAVDPIGVQTILQTNEIAAHLDITIVPLYRKCGIASKLQQQQLQDLKGKGVRRITASIAEWNSRSVSFHEKQGWTFHGIVGGSWQISKDL